MEEFPPTDVSSYLVDVLSRLPPPVPVLLRGGGGELLGPGDPLVVLAGDLQLSRRAAAQALVLRTTSRIPAEFFPQCRSQILGLLFKLPNKREIDS